MLVLSHFPHYGPVNARTGQPMFPHYSRTVLSALAAVLIAGVLTSFLLLRRAHHGWPKILAGMGLVLLIPAQAILVVWIELSLFGK